LQEETDQQPPEPSSPIEKRVNRLEQIANQSDPEERMEISLSVRVLKQVFEKVGNLVRRDGTYLVSWLYGVLPMKFWVVRNSPRVSGPHRKPVLQDEMLGAEDFYREDLEDLLREGTWKEGFNEWTEYTDLDEGSVRIVNDLGLFRAFDFYPPSHQP
jgi:hypothetical protein